MVDKESLPVFQEIIVPILNELLPAFGNDEESTQLVLTMVEKGMTLASTISDKDKEIALGFLKVAKTSLEISEQRLKLRDYAKTVSECAIATENLAKAFGILFLGYSDFGEEDHRLKKIQHEPSKAFVMILNEPISETFIQYAEKVTEKNIELPPYKNLMQNVDDLYNNPQLQKIDSKPLKELLNITPSIVNEIMNQVGLIENVMKKVQTELGEILGEIIHIDIQSDEILELISIIFTSPIDLFILTILLTPHYNSSRFANFKSPSRFNEEGLTTEDYNESVGIVVVLPEILERLENVYALFELTSIIS